MATSTSVPPPQYQEPPPKKPKIEHSSICSLPDNFSANIPTPPAIQFTMDDLANDFASNPGPNFTLKESPLDVLFQDSPLNFFSLLDSQVPGQQNNSSTQKGTTVAEPMKEPHQQTLPSSPLSTGWEQPPPFLSPCLPTRKSGQLQSDIDSSKKRQADRAARNRESSRRAREKHKNRFRLLERGYQEQQQKLQSQQIEIDHLNYLLANVIHNLCSECSYKTTAVLHKKPRN